MNKSEQIARLRLIRTRNISPMTYSQLMRRYGSAEAAIAAIPTLAQRGGNKFLRPASPANSANMAILFYQAWPAASMLRRIAGRWTTAPLA